ncbi:MAG: 16S rRNA (uracil(1498)-N(3))-methyltransferase [Deltaproteobacteria bacterium]|nr:16S rRNA (uracil(1498)-N(3))-methyltransferase [Deltaproteobacteria bacterium]
MPQFRIDPPTITNETVAITGPLAHHVTRVLRCAAGATLRLTDARGTTWRGRIVEATPRVVTVALGAARLEPPPSTRITLAVALLPRDRWRIAVEKSVELGADVIQPLLTARTLIRATERTPRQVAHWQQIADGAAEQCETAWWPQVNAPRPLTALLQDVTQFDRVVWCREREPSATMPTQPATAATRLLCMIGPEGGWTNEEIAQITAANAEPLSLGPRILRTETAALAALIHLQR